MRKYLFQIKTLHLDMSLLLKDKSIFHPQTHLSQCRHHLSGKQRGSQNLHAYSMTAFQAYGNVKEEGVLLLEINILPRKGKHISNAETF